MNPRVSVVMAAYQAEATVGAAVESVLWQRYPDFELVVVDDGSTDATAAIVAAHRGPLRLVQQQNAGVGAARNHGIAEATGELITFCDADDLVFERHLEALVTVYQRAGTGLATANSYWLLPGGVHASKVRYKGGFPTPEHQRAAILEQNFLSPMTVFPRRLVDEVGPLDESRSRTEDWDLWLRAIFAGYRVALQPEPLSLYRWGATGLSSLWAAMDADVDAIYRDLEARFELTDEERSYVRRRRASPGPRRLSRQGDRALRAGHYRDAARLYAEAAALCPSERMLVWKARALAPAPRLIGPLVRARQLRIEAQLGLDEDRAR
jgi:glycosyltransferase involved in cell wall biosynthesis